MLTTVRALILLSGLLRARVAVAQKLLISHTTLVPAHVLRDGLSTPGRGEHGERDAK